MTNILLYKHTMSEWATKYNIIKCTQKVYKKKKSIHEEEETWQASEVKIEKLIISRKNCDKE